METEDCGKAPVLWWATDGGRTQSPVLECVVPHILFKRYTRGHIYGEEGGYCRAEGGERQNLPPLWGVPVPGRHHPQGQRHQQPLNCSILTTPGESPSQLCGSDRSWPQVLMSAFHRNQELWGQREETGHLKYPSAHTTQNPYDNVPHKC